MAINMHKILCLLLCWHIAAGLQVTTMVCHLLTGTINSMFMPALSNVL